LLEKWNVRSVESVLLVMYPDWSCQRPIRVDEVDEEEVVPPRHLRSNTRLVASFCFRLVRAQFIVGATLTGTTSDIPADATVDTDNPTFANYNENFGVAPFDRDQISVPVLKGVLHIQNSLPVFRKKVWIKKVSVPCFYIYITGIQKN
jgi:hypothetical protein